MKDVSDVKGVGDIRTALSTHLRSTSRHKGTPYQEIFAFGMIRLRLERELEVLAKREERAQRHLNDAMKVIEADIRQIQGTASPAPVAGGANGEEGSAPGPWRKMTVEY